MPVNRMRPKALLYRLGEENETGRALRAVLREQKILTLSVDETQLGETVGRLVSANGTAPGAPTTANAPEAGFLLLCSLGDRQLERLLAAMRRAGVCVPYKAVLTEANRDWTLGSLIEAVVREHDAMHGQ